MSTLDLNNLSVVHKKQLNRIFISFQPEFILFLDKLFSKLNNETFILLHSIFSRNLYHSRLYLFFCNLILIRDLGDSITKVICYNNIEKNIIKSNFEYINVKVGKRNSFRSFTTLKTFLKMIIKATYLLLIKDKKRCILSPDEEYTIIDTFLTKKSLVNEKFTDRNYTNILNFIKRDKHSKIYFIPTLLAYPGSKKLNKIIKNSKENLIFKHDYLRISDYLNALIILFKVSKIKVSKITFMDFNVSEIINYNFKYLTFNNIMFEAILNYNFSKSLKKSHINVKCLIDWNENQSSDKGLILGFKTFFPNCITKGYQGYIISTDYNWYIKPTELEYKNNLIPNIIYVMGNSMKQTIKSYVNNIDVRTAPSYRFTNVFKQINTRKLAKSILVILPISEIESYNILSIILGSKIQYNRKVFIKPHPLLNLNKILQNFEGTLSNIFITNDDINLMLQKCQISVGSSSSSLMESLVRCSPVIIISNNIINNPIPKNINKKLWSVVFDSKEFLIELKGIDNYLQNEDQDIKIESKKILENYFCKPSFINTQQFIYEG